MNNENFDLVQKLFELPWYNLILISLIIIPVFIGTWASLINSFSLNLNDKQKRTLSTTFIMLYIIGVVVGKIGHDREQDRNSKQMVETLKADLKSNKGILGFRRIRERHPSYDENSLYKIADQYPGIFGIAPIADPHNNQLKDKDDPIGLVLR
ncbi:hypothetical protein [Chryseobacterium sp. KCF3-3]|uniref:hypothetical protein n=1 Tax=Chryseobacterium sp. KCF3-3 TaxID=3231511 RepID=UPI0038B38B00